MVVVVGVHFGPSATVGSGYRFEGATPPLLSSPGGSPLTWAFVIFISSFFFSTIFNPPWSDILKVRLAENWDGVRACSGITYQLGGEQLGPMVTFLQGDSLYHPHCLQLWKPPLLVPPHLPGPLQWLPVSQATLNASQLGLCPSKSLTMTRTLAPSSALHPPGQNSRYLPRFHAYFYTESTLRGSLPLCLHSQLLARRIIGESLGRIVGMGLEHMYDMFGALS